MVDEFSALMGNNIGKLVSLRLRNNTTVQGILKDFDIHMNLTMDDAKDVTSSPTLIGKILLRGDNILAISLPDDQ